MKISNKLFLGFLVVILLNCTFVIIISRLTKLNSVSSMMKQQNSLKEHLLNAATLHLSQSRSFLIYKKLGKKESLEKFIYEGKKSIGNLDSIKNSMENLISMDLKLNFDIEQSKQDVRLMDILQSGIIDKNRIYQETFIQYKNMNDDSLLSPLQKKIICDSLYTIAISIDSMLNINFNKAASLNEVNSVLRLEDIGSRIDEIKNFTRIILLSIILFSVIFAFIFSSHISRRLKLLKKWTTKIAKGEFNLARGNIFSKDELGDLADSFYEMASELKDAQEKLSRSSRLAAIGEIVASVNHEINNPLMIISGNAQFLELTIDQGVTEDVKDRIRSIIFECDRISAVTQKLRDIKNPVVENYTSSGEQMINLDKSSKESDIK